MDFDLSDEQRLLKDGVDRLLADQYAFEARRRYQQQPDGFSRAMWGRYAEMGLLALPFAQEDGGFGGTAVETMIVMEGLGRHLVLEPYLATVVYAGALLRAAARPEQRRELAQRVGSGRLLLAVAHGEAQSRYDLTQVRTRARHTGSGWLIDGAKSVVLHGASADRLIVSARTESGELSLFVVDRTVPGIVVKDYPTFDGLRAADITFESVALPQAALLGEPGDAQRAIDTAADQTMAALVAEAVGAMSVVHEVTLEYLKTRQQFGTTIGSFQVLQHRAVDMLIALEQARSMAVYAAMNADDSDPLKRRRAISAAKIQIGRSGRFVGQQGIQLHGGIGVTEECQVGHLFRRLMAIDTLFGDADHHLAQLARAGGLAD